ncbi:uncharacterized protein LOC131000500 [Salvia miltiorrhiza]|uniref:uncharacterized protein LOC131000500 n=1 Tax=Salvia miltiorrhiza TaxID=226208 RepID=UPI0025AC4ABA|nr:uncharacterized protein LOC131000500 [Salvia miltiorrhiza]
MKKGGGVSERYGDKETEIGGVTNKKKMKKNMQRLGGRGGLSLASFANAKARNDNYNPSVIKKQREFYKNAKYVKKYKKTINQQEHRSTPSTTQGLLEGENVANEVNRARQKKTMYKKNARNLQELYEKKHEEQEKARIEREAMIEAKKEEREASEARRRALKEKMYKKTRSGQPVMKYRVEHMLETIQASTS